MIGDYWVSNRTGRIYEVGPPGTRWRAVGHSGDLGVLSTLPALLGYAGAALGLSLVVGVILAAFVGVVLGAILMLVPVAIPFSVPLLLLLVVGVGIRSLVTRRRIGPVLQAVAAFVAVLAVVVLHVVYWPDTAGLYVSMASLPLMPVLTLALAVWAAVRRRWALGASLLAQTFVFAMSYLGAVGSVNYAQSGTGVDNVLSVAFWFCVA